MTEAPESTVLDEALAIIDLGLKDMIQRELVSTNDVADLLLDVRAILVQADKQVEVATA